jgi:hypothetical protein
MTVYFVKYQGVGVTIFYLMVGSVDSTLVGFMMFYTQVTIVRSAKCQYAEIMILEAMLFTV